MTNWKFIILRRILFEDKKKRKESSNKLKNNLRTARRIKLSIDSPGRGGGGELTQSICKSSSKVECGDSLSLNSLTVPWWR